MTEAVSDGSEAATVIQLAALTGARLNEIVTLTREDVKTVAGVLVLSINEDHEHKSLKNKQSARLIPLVSAHGFDAEAFAESLSELPQGSRLFNAGVSFGRTVNAKLREFHGLTDDGSLVFHSLRHSLATSMKSQGVSLAHAQAILGHSTGSISFDLYGKGAGLDLAGLMDSLKVAHRVAWD